MGLFFALRGADAGGRLAAARGVCEKLGFRNPKIFDADGMAVHVYPKRGQSEANAVALENGDFVAACGTFIYREEMGEVALRRFHADFAGDFAILANAMCHFGLIVRKNGRLHISPDQAGNYHIFRDADASIVSSSFLVAAATLDRISVPAQSVFEYVFNGVVSGNATLARELTLLPVGGSLRIEHGRATLDQIAPQPPRESSPLGRSELIDRSFAELERGFGILVRLFGDRVTCALSGGYDSRLILAMLERLGSHPRVYVYGRPEDADVRIASQIAAGEGFALEITDKSGAPPLDPDRFAETVARNFLALDGYGWTGVFHNDSEEVERARRAIGGAIALNGGGGEILRNFFYLPNRRYTPRQLLWSFYAQFDPGLCTPVFDEDAYYRGLERKLAELTGAVDRLERPTVEWLYHRFRCRAWDGRIDTINGQYGFTGLPFQMPSLTELAARIPIAWKNYGLLELELTRRAALSLARYPSAYRYDFTSDPPFGARAAFWGTYLRPPALRRFTHRLRHRLHHEVPEPYLHRHYWSRALPDGIEAMRRYFRIDETAEDGRYDGDKLARILSLEYLARQFGSQIRFEAQHE